MLSAGDVLTYLMSRGLIGAEAVVDGDLLIVDASRRHSNFRVLSSAGPSYFVKQDSNSDGVGTVGYEAALYGLLASSSLKNELDFALPRRRVYDPEQGVLVLDFTPDAENLREHHNRRKRFPPAPAALVGRMLGSLHRSLTREALARSEFEGLSRQPPASLSMYCPPLRRFQSVSQANVALIKQIQQFPQFCRLLEEVADFWSAEALIHGDVRWDNWVILRPPEGKRRVALSLIDWEFAGVGDPAWDVGVFLGEYLSFWTLSIPATAEGSVLELVAQATSPIEHMQPALRSFWGAYAERAGLEPAAAEERLLRAVRYMGVRLLETAFEQLHRATQIVRAAVHLVQLSMNVLERPQDAIPRLLGITLQDSGVI